MNEFLAYQRRLLAVIAVVSLLGVAVLFAFFSSHLTWISGWTLGCLVGVAVFRIRVWAVLSLAQLPPEQWQARSMKLGTLGFLLLVAGGVVTIVAQQYFSPWAYLAGALAERAVLLIDGAFRPAVVCPLSPATPADGASAMGSDGSSEPPCAAQR